jgi:hypothetical protein
VYHTGEHARAAAALEHSDRTLVFVVEPDPHAPAEE